MTIDILNKLRGARYYYVRLRSKYDRGRALVGIFIDFSQVVVMAGLGIDLWNKYEILGIYIPMDWLWKLMPVVVTIFFLLGHLDQTKLKLIHAENQYNTNNLNPHLKEMGENIKEIKRSLKLKDNKNYGGHKILHKSFTRVRPDSPESKRRLYRRNAPIKR
jgi:hypothetical protein